MQSRDETLKYANLTFDMKTGSAKGWSKYFETVRELAKVAPRRSLEEVLGTSLTPIGSLKIGTVLITPAMAWELLLKHNKKNRPIAYSHAARLALEILAGHWMLTHQGGAFNMDEDMEDMQHRLLAIILANRPAMILIICGLSKDLFKVIDIGKTRSAGSALEIAGHNGESNILGQIAINLAIPYDEDDLRYFRGTKNAAKRPISRTEMIEYVDNHPGLVERAHDALDHHATSLKVIGDKVPCIFAYWKIWEAFGIEVADSFMEALANDDHGDRHPVTLLQNRLNKHRLGKLAGKNDAAKKNVLNRDQITWLIAAAFRAMRKNTRTVRLDPRHDDPFPRFEDSVVPQIAVVSDTPLLADMMN